MVNPAPGLAAATGYRRLGSHWRACGWHTGVDFPGPLGHGLVAAIPGTIRHRRYGSAFGPNQFAISPDSGPFKDGEVFYAHTLDRLPDGTQVAAGQHVARLGNLGNVTGPHLHFELHSRKNLWNCGVMMNPQPAIDWQGQQQAPAPGGAVVYLSKLHTGQRDSDSVRLVQRRLIALGFGIPAGATGNWGPQTDAAVRAWQQSIGDPPDPPGRVGIGPKQAARLFAGTGTQIRA